MSVYITVELQRKIRAQFHNCCAYCQTAEALIVTNFEFDHIIPLANGGQTLEQNLCLACPSCNRYKSNRQTVIDPLSQEEVQLFHPQNQNWNEHFIWNEDATEIIGQTSVGRATILALKMNRPEIIRVRRMWFQLGVHPP